MLYDASPQTTSTRASWSRAANPYHAACARRVSAAGLAPTSGQVVTQFQSAGSRTDSPVRILLYRGGLVSSAFRLLRRSGVGCHSQDPRFSSGSALWPSHDGIRRMRRTNLPRRPCRKTYGRHKDSKRTRLIHRPCGDIAPPVGGIHVFSCRVLLCTTRCEIRHDARHKCALTARSLLFAQSR
jgi:hypothetical protein